MAAPTFIGEVETAWNVGTTPKTSPSISAEAGDLLVAIGECADGDQALNTPTNSGAALTWTLRENAGAQSSARVSIWTAEVDTTRSLTVTMTATEGAFGGQLWGFAVQQWRDHTGVGAAESTVGASGAPSRAITTTEDDSALVVASSDWNAIDGAARTWRSVNGSAATETVYFRDAAAYTNYVGYHPDAGVAGAKTVGLSAPSGQKYSIAAIEVLGTAGEPVDAEVVAPPADAVGTFPLSGNEISSEVDEPPPAAGTGGLPVPGVSTGDNAEVVAPPAAATGDLPAPGVTRGDAGVAPDHDTPTSLALDAHAATLVLDSHVAKLELDAHQSSLELDP